MLSLWKYYLSKIIKGGILKMECKRCRGHKFSKSGFTFRDHEKVQQYRCKICGTIRIDKDGELNEKSS
jgi:transposase-like protein